MARERADRRRGMVVRYSACLIAAMSFGCAPSISMSPSPTLSSLERGKVHVAHVRTVGDEDLFRATYIVFAQPDEVWRAALEVRRWLTNTQSVWSVSPIERGSDSADPGDEAYLLTWADGRTQSLSIVSNAYTRELQIAVSPGSEQESRLGHCRIRVRPFLENSTLVTADLRISRRLETRLMDTLLLFIKAIDGSSIEARLQAFCEQLAAEHRHASRRHRIEPVTDRTHVIAIGVDVLQHAAAWRAVGVEARSSARRDAEAFAEWAESTLPKSGGDLLRELLTGERGGSRDVQRLIADIEDEEGPIRPGDTVLVFFSGRVVVGRDPLVAGDQRGEQYPHLLLRDSEPGRYLPFTAVRQARLLEALRSSRAGRVLYLCDAGIGVPAGLGDPAPRRPRGEPVSSDELKIAVITARDLSGQGVVVGERRLGMLTESILGGLRGAADIDGDLLVTLPELWFHVRDEVPRLSEGRQEPLAHIPPAPGWRELSWAVVGLSAP